MIISSLDLAKIKQHTPDVNTKPLRKREADYYEKPSTLRFEATEWIIFQKTLTAEMM